MTRAEVERIVGHRLDDRPPPNLNPNRRHDLYLGDGVPWFVAYDGGALCVFCGFDDKVKFAAYYQNDGESQFMRRVRLLLRRLGLA
jgi:hypothetical protein